MTESNASLEPSSYQIEFSVKCPLDHQDESEYITPIEGRIICPQATAASEGVEVGWVCAYLVHAGRALNDRRSLWDECDAFEQVTSDYYSIFYGRDGEFSPDVKATFPHAISTDLLILDVVRVDRNHRGQRLGLIAARRLMDIFEPEGGLVACKPFPLQFQAERGDEPDRPREFEGLAMDEATAYRRLRRYWASLGFRRVGASDYFALDTTQVAPTIRDLLDLSSEY